jgi:hypothetical protein
LHAARELAELLSRQPSNSQQNLRNDLGIERSWNNNYGHASGDALLRELALLPRAAATDPAISLRAMGATSFASGLPIRKRHAPSSVWNDCGHAGGARFHSLIGGIVLSFLRLVCGSAAALIAV